MNQGDLAHAVAAATGPGRAEAARAVRAMTDTIRDGLKRGEKIRINGFGVFETAHREAWRGRNPRTGEAVEVPALASVRFRPGKELRDIFDGGGASSARSSR